MCMDIIASNINDTQRLTTRGPWRPALIDIAKKKQDIVEAKLLHFFAASTLVK